MFKKYLIIIKIAWQQQLVYRANFFGFRVGQLFEMAAQIIIWTMIFRGAEVVRGYTYEEMITYIIVGWLFYYVTNNYAIENTVARHIKSGELSNFLSKPIDYIRYIVTLSIGRISIALLSGIISQVILIIIFYKLILFNVGIQEILVILLMLFFGYFVHLFYKIMVGFIAFWSIETVGLFYMFSVMFNFLAGRYFPINLLPDSVATVSSYFPFAYSFYAPTQIYLGKMSVYDGLRGVGIQVIWLFFFYVLTRIIWKKGLKKYESVGI